MNVSEIISILWRRKLVVAAAVIVAIGAAYGALRGIQKEYEATSTVALQTRQLNSNSVFILQVIDVITSIYATAGETKTTQALAAQRTGGKLASISVHTFQSSPIMKIVARGPDPDLDRRSAQAVTDALLARAQSGSVGLPSIRLTQIDQPTTPTSPVYPNRKLTFVVAGLLGLGLGIAAALIWETLGRRVRTRVDLAEAAGVPVFAEVPEQRALRSRLSVEGLLRDPQFRTVTEALRDLRTNLVFADGNYGSIVITSPEGRHGKTTVSVGLAATIATAGIRTLLVDGDLRRGRIAELLDVGRAPGLYELLNGAPLESIVRSTPLAELDLITSGRTLSDPGEILTMRLPELIDGLKKGYDAIVFDTTPLVPVNDARLFARLADRVVLVVSADQTPRRSVREAIERLDLISVNLTAAVLNKSNSRLASSYYGVDDDGLGPTPDLQVVTPKQVRRSRTRAR